MFAYDWKFEDRCVLEFLVCAEYGFQQNSLSKEMVNKMKDMNKNEKIKALREKLNTLDSRIKRTKENSIKEINTQQLNDLTSLLKGINRNYLVDIEKCKDIEKIEPQFLADLNRFIKNLLIPLTQHQKKALKQLNRKMAANADRNNAKLEKELTAEGKFNGVIINEDGSDRISKLINEED